MTGAPTILAGRYRLVESLGGGGTSLVHRAQVVGGGPDVALKQLRPQLAADASLRRRFLREAELAQGLRHPGIVRLLDAGEDGGVPFLVMELVRDETLRQRLDRDGRLPMETAWPIFSALARALDHAHGRGVIHRDVKPANVFVGPTDVKLADFGNARVVSLASVTGASLTWGTPEYVAPEMFMRGRADPRSDLYALGVVLYEMLAGRLPWSRADTLARLGSRAGTTPRIAPTGAGQAVDDLIRELLSFSPADRPASGEEMILRLSEPELPPVTAIATDTTCSRCGARKPGDVPRCLACGQEALRLGHVQGGRWRLILQRLDDDATATAGLLRVLDSLAQPVKTALHFLTGSQALYSDDEHKAGIALPAVLFSDLDQSTARTLASLFQHPGFEVRAVEGKPVTRPAEPSTGTRTNARMIQATVINGTIVLGSLATLWSGQHVGPAGMMLVLSLVGTGVMINRAVVPRRRRLQSSKGILSLRDQIAAVPVADGLLAHGASAVGEIRAPEIRALLADLTTEIYRLTRRAEQLGAGRPSRAAVSSEAELLRRTTAEAPALTKRLHRIAAQLDGLDEALAGPTEGELMQMLARLERAAAAPGADRQALAVTRRDLEASLERRHATEQSRARLAAALCRMLGRLRHAYRRARALQTLDEQEARAIEAASAELETYLLPPVAPA